MAANDKLLPNVLEALDLDGWKVTAKPYTIRRNKYLFLIDIGADKNGQKICVEVKSWLSNFITDFHASIGQVTNYQYLLSQKEPDRKLYLAVPLDVYQKHFTKPLIKDLVKHHSINLLIFDSTFNKVVSWQ